MQPEQQPAPSTSSPDATLERLHAELASRVSPAELPAVGELLRLSYATTAPEELRDLDPAAAVGPIVSLWRLAQQPRRPGEVLVRVYDPQAERDGWSSSHTAIDIVNDDMPFLLASTNGELRQQQRQVTVALHPMIGVRRDGEGRIEEAGREGNLESWMHLEIDRMAGGEDEHRALEARLRDVFSKVRRVVEDWAPMKAKAEAVAAQLRQSPPPLDPGEVREAAELLDYLADNHFTFLGYRGYVLDRREEGDFLRVEPHSGLGILREVSAETEGRSESPLPDYLATFLQQQELLIITKATRRAEVHRPVHMDSVGVRRFDAQGKVIGEDRFLGIFTTTVYGQSPQTTPVLRRKVERTLRRANFNHGSHDAKALANVLETIPRDELFQIGEDDLFRIAIGILQLQQRHRVAVFLRKDEFERFVSALVFVPRERFTNELRDKIGKVLERELGGEITIGTVALGEGALARFHYIVKTTPGKLPQLDARQLEAQIGAATRTWPEEVGERLIGEHGEERGGVLAATYAEAFPPVYRDRFGAGEALADVPVLEKLLSGSGDFDVRLYRNPEMPAERMRIKLYLAGRQIALSDALPLLENMGVRVEEELPFQVKPKSGAQTGGGKEVWIHDFALVAPEGTQIDFAQAQPAVEETMRRVWRGDIEDGVLNRLVLAAGLSWRQIAMLRGYSRYLRQIGLPFSQRYMAETLVANPAIAKELVALFDALFDPTQGEDSRSRAAGVLSTLREALDEVQSADHDRILRGYLTAIKETLRTNFYQRGAPSGSNQNGEPKQYISFKLDCRQIRQLPDPKPMYEIFVYSPRMEGVHLRGGKVARGGIRWSDRREDFRTEILGLLKAQMVKNAVIVPVGSKGGFVVKNPPTTGGREAQLAEGIECYKTLIRGLLDITDNIVAGELVPPRDVVRRDADDPYLVVAADKGTATFSDIANGVSKEYGFWLGDAFASGGSAGYDHKKMGITAKGAWEAVKRHFREMGRDIQTTPFTTVGVGDMSGDVFGNGMLLSRHTRLLAAFDHRHIFIDPNPDTAVSFAERQRLFDLPRSSWADYDASKLSPGGGVYERTAKNIQISDEAAQALGITDKRLTPQELMQAILLAPVDLLWLGGIGTYVKASTERHGEAGDRANDALRVDGNQLRCKVIGEGANLGFTQRGRIEFGLCGGRLNTDAIDNSAGVDTSDHEVNIKIATGDAMTRGELTLEQRDALLASMTDEVGDLVLRDNYLQTQAISLAAVRAFELLDQQARMIRAFEKMGRLDRKIEFLPDDEEIRQRAAQKRGLTRPELAVILAYSKILLYEDLLASDVPDDPLLAEDLIRYFPGPMVERLRPQIERHRLRREIVATYITNSTVNRVGPSFVFRMMEATGKSAQNVARAYTITRDAFELRPLWAGIEALDNKVSADLQLQLLLEISKLTEHATLWFLTRYDGPLEVAAVVGTFRPALRDLGREMEPLLPAEARRDLERRIALYTQQGVPETLARQVASLRGLVAGTDVVRLALALEAQIEAVARVYFALGDRLGLDWLRSAGSRVKIETAWQRTALEGTLDDFSQHQVAIAWQVLAEAGKKAEWAEAVQAWQARHGEELQSLDRLLEELKAAEAVDLAMLTVADRQLQGLSGR